MSELYVAESHIGQRLKASGNAVGCIVVGVGRTEKLYRVIDRHVEHIGYIFTTIADVEHIALVAQAVTLLTFDGDIGHKLHLYCDGALALASLATSALDIEKRNSPKDIPAALPPAARQRGV